MVPSSAETLSPGPRSCSRQGGEQAVHTHVGVGLVERPFALAGGVGQLVAGVVDHELHVGVGVCRGPDVFRRSRGRVERDALVGTDELHAESLRLVEEPVSVVVVEAPRRHPVAVDELAQRVHLPPDGVEAVAPGLHPVGLAVVRVDDRVVEETPGPGEPVDHLAGSRELVVEQHAPLGNPGIRREHGDVDVGLQEHAPQVLGEVVDGHAVDAVPPGRREVAVHLQRRLLERLVVGAAGDVVRLHVDEEVVAAERGLRGVGIECGLRWHAVVLVTELGVEGEQAGRGTDPARGVQRLRPRQRRRSGLHLLGDTRPDPPIAGGEGDRRVLVGAAALQQDRERRGFGHQLIPSTGR